MIGNVVPLALSGTMFLLFAFAILVFTPIVMAVGAAQVRSRARRALESLPTEPGTIAFAVARSRPLSRALGRIAPGLPPMWIGVLVVHVEANEISFWIPGLVPERLVVLPRAAVRSVDVVGGSTPFRTRTLRLTFATSSQPTVMVPLVVIGRRPAFFFIAPSDEYRAIADRLAPTGS